MPSQLPAGEHGDPGRRLNPARPCCSGSPAISHAPGSWQSWHPGGGRPRLPPLRLTKRLSALPLHCLGVFLGLRAGREPEASFSLLWGVQASPRSRNLGAVWFCRFPVSEPNSCGGNRRPGDGNEFVSAAVGGGGRIKRFPGGLIKGPRLEFWVEIVRGGRMYPRKEEGKCLETNRNVAKRFWFWYLPGNCFAFPHGKCQGYFIKCVNFLI